MKRWFVILLFVLLPLPARAATFNPNAILSDFELTDHVSMWREAIQTFLENKTSFLAKYKALNVNDLLFDAAQIIYDAAIAARA